MVLCHDGQGPAGDVLMIRRELDVAGIDLPCLVAATRCDESSHQDVSGLRDGLTDVEIIPVSVLDDDSLDELRSAIWRLTGLVRVHLRKDGEDDRVPLAFRPPVRVLDVAHAIHHDLASQCAGARIWGSSARFPGQKVGTDHLLGDDDHVEILT
jgi:ribosome-interacting GTPase 1